jgi:hypothetical protein
MPNYQNNLTEFPSGDVTFHIKGQAGKIEILTSMPTSTSKPIIGVICHPHPLFGGTMHNKVVYTIARAFKEMGMPTVRFNFRGVGTSEGQYDEGNGETDDLMSVLKWVQQVQPQAQIWLAGFSFGSYVAARAADLWPARQLISVAPPVVNFNFAELPMIKCPWLIVQGDADEIVDPNAVFAWIDHLPQAPEVIRMQGASHFFHGQLIELRQALISALSPKINL